MLKNITQLWKNITQFIYFREQYAKTVNQLHIIPAKGGQDHWFIHERIEYVPNNKA